jgi:hypothetical protein
VQSNPYGALYGSRADDGSESALTKLVKALFDVASFGVLKVENI